MFSHVSLAENTSVFTKDGDQHNNFDDMVCMWLVFHTNFMLNIWVMYYIFYPFQLNVVTFLFLFLFF